MNPMHIHLAASHVPLVALTLGLAAIQGGVWKSRLNLTRAGLWLVIAAALASLAVAVTGFASKEFAIFALGAPASLVEFHQKRALATVALLLATALSAVYALRFGPARGAPSRLAAGIAAASAVGIGMLIGTSWHGGGIRHPEIQPYWKELRLP